MLTEEIIKAIKAGQKVQFTDTKGNWEDYDKQYAFDLCLAWERQWRIKPKFYTLVIWLSEKPDPALKSCNLDNYLIGYDPIWSPIKTERCPYKYEITVQEVE